MKYLEIADFHASSKWIDFSVEQGHVVAEAARREDVDFIVTTGDFFDGPEYANNTGRIDQLKAIMRELLSVCPVVGIEGTPSHDAPGCYSIFEELGFVLLKPGKVYGLFGKDLSGALTNHGNHLIISEISSGFSDLNPDAILFGVPELNKHNIQAKLGLSAEDANAEALKQFNRYVREFIAPMRQKHTGIPAIGVLHGNVSDSERSNETDIILKSSDIVIYTEDLEPAGLDRWSLGHIHTPWESNKINAGYAGFPGMDKNPWGKRDFKPAFNLVTDGIVQRLQYSAPERRKVSSMSDISPFDDVAWWIDTKDKSEELPEGLHPWSRITYKEVKRDTRRVSTEEASAVKSLWDLFKLIDPDVDDGLKEKVDLITETVKHDPPGKKDVVVSRVSVSGCIFFKEKTATLEIDALPDGLNLVTGQNGDGKSSLLSFCSPYPVVIGKDTKSGRDSAIKDFFSGRDSKIEKTVYLNGVKHKHLITIKAAHTKSPKTECYLTIDGQPVLDKGSFDEMLTACEELYGSLSDYRITTFCEQPQQAAENLSGLMSAKPIDARNIVQAIAGVSREAEKRFALDRAYETETAIKEHLIKIETLESDLSDPEPLRSSKAIVDESALNASLELETIKTSGQAARTCLDDLRILLDAETDKKSRRALIEQSIQSLRKDYDRSESRIKELQFLASFIESNRAKIKDDDKAREELKRIEEIERYNMNLKTSYLEAVSAYNEYRRIVDSNASIDREAALWNKPCEHCGKLSSNATSKIEELKSRKVNVEAIVEPKQPEYKPVLDKPLTLSNRDQILSDISRGESATEEIKTLTELSKTKANEAEKLKKELSTIEIDETITERYSSAQREVDRLTALYRDKSIELERLRGQSSSLADKIEGIKDTQRRIDELKAYSGEETLKAWKYIASMLGSDKVPALELDMFLDLIDEEATENIEPFLEGRFAYSTTTQEEGKKNKIDRFDITIIDRQTAVEQSLFTYNPGHKAFFSDAYIKALIKQRNNRMQRSYSPIIFDEADGPIREERIPMYYDINRKYFEKDSAVVLVVSQKKSAENYMANVININDLKE